MKLQSVGIAGLGRYLPSTRVTNADFEKVVETTDEWIFQRTGIRERRRASDDEISSSLAVKASQQALEDAGITPEEIGLVIVATATPDQPFPATAVQVIEDLGCVNAGGWDLSAACSGFVFAGQAATQYVATGAHEAVLVIGVEILTRIVDYTDRATCVLFGDGAGAAIFTSFERAGRLEYLAGSTKARPDRTAIMQPGGGSRHPASHESVESRLHYLKMDGRRTFKSAVRTFAEMLEQSVAEYGGLSELGMVVPHQMNQRIMEAVADRLDISIDLFYTNVVKYGNTSAASVPIAMREAIDDGRFESLKGQLVCLCAFGAGLGYGHILVRV